MFEKMCIAEEWKDVPGYEGHYQVSNLGNLRSVKKTPFVILKPMTATNGYLIACLWKDGKQTKICIHRLVATTFLDNPKALKEVNHKDEDKTNNRVDNLEWCSHLYNMNYGNIKKKISDGNKGKKLSDTHRRKVGIASSQHRWVHKESVERFVYLSEIDKFLLDGWRIGRTFKRRGMYV